jgi:hypothetical protein
MTRLFNNQGMIFPALEQGNKKTKKTKNNPGELPYLLPRYLILRILKIKPRAHGDMGVVGPTLIVGKSKFSRARKAIQTGISELSMHWTEQLDFG